MANKKISDLMAASAITGSELIEVEQSSTSKYTTPADLKTYIAPQYAKISDTKSAGTAGGGFTSGAWQTRTLNTEDSDSAGIASISSNQINLQAGTYRVRANAPGYYCAYHKAVLYNVTDAADTLIGSSEYSPAVGQDQAQSQSHICGEFTIASAKAFEIRHRCTTTRGTDGFGAAVNFGVSEVYTVVEIWKVA